MAKSIDAQMSRFFALMDSETVTKDDFENAFKQVITLVEQILERQKKFEIELHGGNSQFRDMVHQEAKKALGDLKTQTNQLFVEGRLKDMSAEQKALFSSLKNNVSSLLDMKMGEMHGEIKKRAIQGIEGREGKVGRAPLTSEIQIAVAPMVEELKKEIERLKETRSNRSMGRAKTQIVRALDLTSQVNGSTNTFTLPMDPVDVLFVYSTQLPEI